MVVGAGAGRCVERRGPTGSREISGPPGRVGPETEWTMEANPSSIDRERMRQYRALGVNRVSMGVQALDSAHRAPPPGVSKSEIKLAPDSL